MPTVLDVLDVLERFRLTLERLESKLDRLLGYDDADKPGAEAPQASPTDEEIADGLARLRSALCPGMASAVAPGA